MPINSCYDSSLFRMSMNSLIHFSTMHYSHVVQQKAMAEREYKEKVKTDEDESKVEREFKDEFGNKVKEKHEVKLD